MAIANYFYFKYHFEVVCVGKGVASLPCLILEGEVSSSNFENQSKSQAKQNDIVKLWKCSLKIGVGGSGWWENSFLKFLHTLLFGLPYIKFLKFKWYSLGFPYVHIIAEILLLFF